LNLPGPTSFRNRVYRRTFLKVVAAVWNGDRLLVLCLHFPEGTGYTGSLFRTFPPRLEGHPLQVGPLAQVLIGYAQGHKLTPKWAAEAIHRVSAITKKRVTQAMLHSTLGRIAVRATRASMLADLASQHRDLHVKKIASGDAKFFVKPQCGEKKLRGVGFHEAPRSRLSHWAVIKDRQFANSQAVVPTPWNAGPRDEHGSHGPYEAALLGNPVAVAQRPLEVLRTVHAFDPRRACAIHTFDPGGKKVIRVS